MQIADHSDQALDFYQQGLRLDDQMFGCAFNIGCVYLNKMKLKNAQKWFKFSRQIRPCSKEAFLGEAISALKLGDQEQCIEIIARTPGQSISKRALSLSEADGTRSPTSPKSISDDQTVVLSNNNGSTIVHVELNIDD